MKFFRKIQEQLENIYGVSTGLDVRDFVRPTPSLKNLGEMLVEQDTQKRDLNVALLFDRDILAAFQSHEDVATKIIDSDSPPTQHAKSYVVPCAPSSPNPRAYSVSFEEISHFVYLSFNHHRGRDITRLELEMQSEVDRILLAFHGPMGLKQEAQTFLLSELLEKSYSSSDSEHTHYELARKIASNFIRMVGANPAAWTPDEFKLLREFFHNDLGGKIHLSKNL